MQGLDKVGETFPANLDSDTEPKTIPSLAGLEGKAFPHGARAVRTAN
jgi:hypothetical protein